MLSWEDLHARSLARQFPSPRSEPDTVAGVADALHAVGAIQAQTARSPYLALAARIPGVTRDTITVAYEQAAIVRGSNLRGTVHTSTPDDHVLLEVATRAGLRRLYERTWRLRQLTVEDVWREIEGFAEAEWRTAQEIHDHVRSWIDQHDPGNESRVDETAGRSLSYGHGGLLRRPLSGGWEGQGKPGYRTATALLGDRSAALDDVEGSLEALVRRHLACHGPSSRHDVAWWSGLGLGVVDAALARLVPHLTTHTGPDGRDYHELVDAPGPRTLPGVRLLPEFDATLCGYDSNRRERFCTPEHFSRLWHQRNALIDAPLMVDGRLVGSWRLVGSGPRRELEVGWFRGARRPRRSELDEPTEALQAAYGVTVTRLSLASAG